MNATDLRVLPLAALTPSPTNPRKTFDPVALEELAESIKEKGLIQPIVVRVHGPGREGYEVVAGERRYRAAMLAQVEELPCILRQLDDVAVLEIQTIENLQRDDLHPLEEAEGFAALMKEAGYDVETIAQKIGRSEKYVYDRIKLLKLTPKLKKIFLAGEISAGHAILLARLSKADQKNALGDDRGLYYGGLFTHDASEEVPGLKLDDTRKRKPKSVRELATWINNNVRFRPADVDLPNLFPDTATALEDAGQRELQVVKITRNYRVPDGAKDPGERTYGSEHWRRADGEPEYRRGKTSASKQCEHQRLGVVVGGPGRGEAFQVCVDKKKCKIHWADAMKESAARKRGGGTSSQQAAVDRAAEHERRRLEREAEGERWKKAQPALLEALAAKLAEKSGLDLVDLVIEECSGYRSEKDPSQIKRGKTLEDRVRFAVFQLLSKSITNEWRAPEDAPKALHQVGISAKQIVNQVAPRPKSKRSAKKVAKKAAKKAAPKKKRAAKKKSA